eukprot:TRINITY_DN84656_c0_g1_i1.p1 TRINITY_DN84656_c0_g1~~TRINITY_DN84656_c0_g1_i1.p1  ORF type:complete len:125 (-),score=28.36 TRINITY_DN84656_c0_g1_i1:22-396(-)
MPCHSIEQLQAKVVLCRPTPNSKAMPHHLTPHGSVPSAMQAQPPQHDYMSLEELPQYVKDEENTAYKTFWQTPPLGHRPEEEAWRWRACPTHELILNTPLTGKEREPSCERKHQLADEECTKMH